MRTLTLEQLQDLRVSIGAAINGSSEMKGSTLSLVLRALDEDGADMDGSSALRENLRSVLNWDSPARGLALLHARTWLEEQIQLRIGEGTCEDCGLELADPDDRFCPACKAGAHNA